MKKVKLLLDILFSALILVITLPLWPIIAILIKIDSKGPVFFLQERYGQHKKSFKIIKFRTMQVGADSSLSQEFKNYNAQNPDRLFDAKQKPQITRVGKILRKSGLDEAPQLINVLFAQMSLIGWRPVLKDETQLIDQIDQSYYDFKPGITGFWQTSPFRNHNIRNKILWDRYYIRHWSLKLDLRIILRTLRFFVESFK